MSFRRPLARTKEQWFRRPGRGCFFCAGERQTRQTRRSVRDRSSAGVRCGVRGRSTARVRIYEKNDIRTFLNQDAKCRRCGIENKWIIAPKTASEGCETKRKTRLIYDRHSGGCGIKGNVPFRTRWIGPHAGGRCPSADIPAKNIPATRPVYRMQNSTSCSRNVIQQIVYDQRPVGEITTIKKAEWRITRCEN